MKDCEIKREMNKRRDEKKLEKRHRNQILASLSREGQNILDAWREKQS